MLVGFIGLGRVGFALAANFLKSGYKLHVWNRTPSKAAPLVRKGAVFARSPKELAAKCDVIFLSVSDGGAVKKVLFGSKGIAKSGKKGLIVVDTSTINPEEAILFAKVLSSKRMFYLEAPLLASPMQVERKQANYVVSGNRRAFGKVLPLLKTSSACIVYFGKSGSASYMKIANNLVHGVLTVASCEAVLMCKKAGLNINRVKEAFAASTVFSPTLGRFMQCCIDNRFPVTFTNTLKLKDAMIAADCGRRLGVPTPANNLAVGLFRKAVKLGLGKESPYAIIKSYEKLAGKARNGKKRKRKV